jgi:DNA-binding protein HU-alpha
MHKAELVAKIAEQAGLTKAEAQTALNALTDSMTDALARNETVSLIGFGTFSQRHRAARQGKNPQTGAALEIAASNNVAFKPGKALKDALNGRG